MRTTAGARAGAVILGFEGIGLAALTVVQGAAIVAGDTGSLATALALAVLTVIGTAAVLAFAFAVWRGISWGRSGGIVTQVLILAVALGAATGAYAHPLIGLALAVPAVVAFVLLVLAARDAGRARARGDDAG